MNDVLPVLVAAVVASITTMIAVRRQYRGWTKPNPYRARWDCPKGCGSWLETSSNHDPAAPLVILDRFAASHECDDE